jgi:hypothetical protein
MSSYRGAVRRAVRRSKVRRDSRQERHDQCAVAVLFHYRQILRPRADFLFVALRHHTANLQDVRQRPMNPSGG